MDFKGAKSGGSLLIRNIRQNGHTTAIFGVLMMFAYRLASVSAKGFSVLWHRRSHGSCADIISSSFSSVSGWSHRFRTSGISSWWPCSACCPWCVGEHPSAQYCPPSSSPSSFGWPARTPRCHGQESITCKLEVTPVRGQFGALHFPSKSEFAE